MLAPTPRVGVTRTKTLRAWVTYMVTILNASRNGVSARKTSTMAILGSLTLASLKTRALPRRCSGPLPLAKS